MSHDDQYDDEDEFGDEYADETYDDSDAYVRGKTHAIIVVAEGASLHGQALIEQLDAMNTGFQFRLTLIKFHLI